MEKTIQLDQREMQQATGIEEQRLRALAQIGAATIDIEQAEANELQGRKALESANEKQRDFIRQTVANHGINQFDSARAVPNGIVVTIPDSIAMPPAPPDKVNGALQPEVV